MKQLAEGIYQWSVFSPQKQYDFNGLYLDLGDARVLVDPPPMSPEVVERIDELGAPGWIYLTNKDHQRDAAQARDRYRARIAIHELDRPMVTCPIDEVFDDGDLLLGALRVIGIPANKTPGEAALYWADRRVLIIGDALIGNPPGSLSMLPPEKFGDPALAHDALEILREVDADMVLVGDGVSIPSDGNAAIRAFLDRR